MKCDVAERSAAIEHGGEARIVIHRREKTAAAGFKTRRGFPVNKLNRLSGFRIAVERLRHALAIGAGYVKGRVPHAKRSENALVEECAERLSADDLNHSPDHVG